MTKLNLTMKQERFIARWLDELSPQQIADRMPGIGIATVTKYINQIACKRLKHQLLNKEQKRLQEMKEKYGPASLDPEKFESRVQKMFVKKDGAIAMTEAASQAGDKQPKTHTSINPSKIFIMDKTKPVR